MNSVGLIRILLSIILTLASAHPALAATIRLSSVADTTLIEYAQDNNMGGNDFVNAGTAGTGTKNRALFKFDLSSIPPDSKITAASLNLEVTGSPLTGAASSTFAIHRMLKNWGEGNKITDGSLGLGSPAETNEATWNSPFAFTTNSWSGPGASNDFVSLASSTADVDPGIGFPVFTSNPQTVSNVQLWLSNLSTNFGWLLKTESEQINKTARRFSSREFSAGDPNSAPSLEIVFVPPPLLVPLDVTNTQFRFSFLVETNQIYAIQFRTNLATTSSWQTFSNVGAFTQPTNVIVSNPVTNGITRFFRVIPQ